LFDINYDHYSIESINKHVPFLKTPLTTKIVIQNFDKFDLPGKNKMYDGQFCEFCDRIFKETSSLTKHIRREHPYHYEEAVFEYFDLAIEISDEIFQIGIELIKANKIGMEQFEVLLDRELAVSDFLIYKTYYKFAIYY
jgi:hypothetical protein